MNEHAPFETIEGLRRLEVERELNRGIDCGEIEQLFIDRTEKNLKIQGYEFRARTLRQPSIKAGLPAPICKISPAGAQNDYEIFPRIRAYGAGHLVLATRASNSISKENIDALLEVTDLLGPAYSGFWNIQASNYDGFHAQFVKEVLPIWKYVGKIGDNAMVSCLSSAGGVSKFDLEGWPFDGILLMSDSRSALVNSVWNELESIGNDGHLDILAHCAEVGRIAVYLALKPKFRINSVEEVTHRKIGGMEKSGLLLINSEEGTSMSEPSETALLKMLEIEWQDHFHMRDQAWKTIQVQSAVAIALVGADIAFRSAGVSIVLSIILVVVSISGLLITWHHRNAQVIKFRHIIRIEEKLHLLSDDLLDVVEPSAYKIRDILNPAVVSTPVFLLRIQVMLFVFSILFVLSSAGVVNVEGPESASGKDPPTASTQSPDLVDPSSKSVDKK